jgi:hypothetical protein
MFRRFFQHRDGAAAAGKAARTAPRRARRSRPALEFLEGRTLLSFAGSEHRVSLNPQATDNFESDNASSANGTSVAVWVNSFSSTDHDIWAQRFDKFGHATGTPIEVDFSGTDSNDPRVAMDASGRFVVTWDDRHADGTHSIMMRDYSASGSPLTGITQVSDTGTDDYNPDVAASNGSLVISWTHQVNSANADIDAERYVITNGVPASPTRIVVNNDTNYEIFSSVAMAPTGKFDIVYARQFSSNDWDILGSQYAADGSLLHGGVHINFDSSFETAPSVALDNAGNAVVTYEENANGNDFGIYANRWSSSNVVSSRILVHDESGVGEYVPAVALAPTGGQFVVAYNSDSGGAEVAEMGSNNSQLTVYTTGGIDVPGGFNPAISIDGLDRYVVTYTKSNPATNHEDIFSRRSFLGTDGRVSLNPQATSNSESDNASSANGTSVVVWSNAFSSSNHDIWAQRFDKTGKPAGAPIEVDFSSSDDSYAPHVAMDGVGDFVVTWENRNLNGTFSVLMRYYNASGAPLTNITQVSAAGSTDYQPDVAASNSSFVITWAHHASTTNDDIFAERFVISSGVPTGQGIFVVNNDTNSEARPSVAMSPNGTFAIAYERQFSGNDWDILASQYSNTGALVRGVTINSDTVPEFNPSIAMDNAGNAVVAYQEQFSNSDYGIFANRLSSSGTVSSRILVYNINGDDAENPSVALEPTGGQFVVAFDDATGELGGVMVTEIDANNATLATFGTFSGAFLGVQAAVSIDASNRYVVTFTNDTARLNLNDVISHRDFLS